MNLLKRLRAFLPLLILVLCGIALYASGVLDRFDPHHVVAHQRELHAQIRAHPWLSRLGYIGLLTAGMATGVPGTIVIILAGGFAFGVVEGTFYSSIGLTLGSLILFAASRYAFSASDRPPPKLAARLHHGFERHPVGYTLFVRFVPVAPFGLITVCLAWLRCPTWLFTSATWLGGTVALVFETSIGAGLGKALRKGDHLSLGLLLNRDVLLPLAAFAVLVILSFLAGRLARPRPPAEEGKDRPVDPRQHLPPGSDGG